MAYQVRRGRIVRISDKDTSGSYPGLVCVREEGSGKALGWVWMHSLVKIHQK